MSAGKNRPVESNGEAANSNNSTSNSSIANATYTSFLISEHLDELQQSAISEEAARRCGVYSAQTVDELPEWARWIHEKYGEDVLPALVYPMTEPDGSETGQVKPAAGSLGDQKYISPTDRGGAPHAPLLPKVRKVDSPKGVLIVEGVKQAIAASAYAPDGWSIYRICGIEGWSRNGVPTPHLRVVKGLPVVVIPDADAASNRAVYDGALRLGEACTARGAESVGFTQTGATGSAGLDDVLAAEPEDCRDEYLQTLITSALPKPAERAPKPLTQQERARKAQARKNAAAVVDGDRPLVHVRGDRLDVIEACDSALHRKFGGQNLFQHGESLGLIESGDCGARVVRVGQGELSNLVAKAAVTVTGDEWQDEDGVCSHAHEWPDNNVMSALMSRRRGYQSLEGISRLPLVRSDGSIVTKTGYDPTTKHYIELSEDLEGISVPSSPTDAEIQAAQKLLVDDLLADFLFKEQPDRAHAVAALLTPLIRPLVPTAPFLVIDGLQRGVGKGMFLEVVSRITSGHEVTFTQLPATEDEMRKKLTASLLAGDTVLTYDEVSELCSPVLNSLATAERWSDRKLGASEQVDVPNRASLYFAGNQIKISGDAARRAVRIRLHTDEPNPENRSGFKHAHLKEWVDEHRCALLEACLVLIRAWYDRDRPSATQPFRFGSFERWQDVVGGILEVAGIPGFLEGVEEQRRESDYEELHWCEHYEWLSDVFGVGMPFTAKEVVNKADADLDSEMPPGLEKDVTTRSLGKAYAGQESRWRGGLRVVKVGKAQGGTVKWMLEAAPGSAVASAPIVQKAAPVQGPTGSLLPPTTDSRAAPIISDRTEEDEK